MKYFIKGLLKTVYVLTVAIPFLILSMILTLVDVICQFGGSEEDGNYYSGKLYDLFFNWL